MNPAFEQALAKVARTAQRLRGTLPYRTLGGRFDDQTDTDVSWWTNGFWGGLLWLTWRETKDPQLAQWAEESETRLDRALEEFEGLHHDVGFQWLITAGAQYRLTGATRSRVRAHHAANLLAGRFNYNGRFIRAWNEGREGWAIIDCLMNLPLLVWASRETGDPRFDAIAVAHAETVQRAFLSLDGSVRHIVEFDPRSGLRLRSHAGQGARDDSAWSRGNAWALYGLTLAGWHAGRGDFLAAARTVAGFFLDHLPGDQVPPADFLAAAGPENPKDSSAAAIAASGLILLGSIESRLGRPDPWTPRAKAIVASLTANYRAPEDDEALLVHGCVAYDEQRPGWNDTTLIYGDYYYLEALARLEGRPGLFEID